MAKTSKRARRTSTFYLPGAFDLFTTSKDIVLKNIWIFGPLYAVPLIFWIHSWIWSPLPTQKTHWWYNADGFSSGWPGGPVPTYFTFLVIGFSIFWALLIMGVGTIAQIMAQEAQLEGAEHKTIDFNNLWKVTKELGWRMLGLYILVGLVVLVGFILLIIPGLIMIRRYLLAPYVMLDKKVGISEAMIGLLNVIPIIGGLTSFIVGSLYSVAPALRYTQLKKLAH
jgi:hypothetical protein